MRRFWPFIIYGLVVVGYHVWMLATPGIDHLGGKALLMPALLVAVLLVGLRTSPVIVASWRSIGAFVLLCIAIAASLLGDVAMGTALQLGLVGLGLAHASYIALFAWPARAHRPSWWAIGYAPAYALVSWMLWPDFGPMVLAVVIYGVILSTGAAFATGVNRLTSIGGALFFVSNVGIAVRWFAPQDLRFFPDPWQDMTLMLLYCAAQGCIAAGVLRRLEAEPTLAVVRRAEVARRRRATYREGYESRSTGVA